MGGAGHRGSAISGMSSTAAVPTQESAVEGASFSRSSETGPSSSQQRSVEATTTTATTTGQGAAAAAALHHPHTNGSPPGVSWGNAGGGVGSGKDGARSVADIIAEAMRENGVQHGNVEVCEGFWARPSAVRAQLADIPEVAAAAAPAGSAAAAAIVPSCASVGGEYSLDGGEAVDLGTIGVAAGAAGEQPGGVVARAMAEAILDEGYMASAADVAASTMQSTATSPSIVCGEIQVIQTNQVRSPPSNVASRCSADIDNASLDVVSRRSPDVGSTSVVPPAATAATGVGSVDKQDVGGTHAVAVDADDAAVEDPAIGACPPSGESGGLAAAAAAAQQSTVSAIDPSFAPFGHAVIIEEHVRATAEIADTVAPGDGNTGAHGQHLPGIDSQVDVGRGVGSLSVVNDGEAKRDDATKVETEHCHAAGREVRFDGQASFRKPEPAGAGAGPAVVAKILEKPAASRATEWSIDEPGGDGFLVLNGGRSVELDSLPGYVCRVTTMGGEAAAAAPLPASVKHAVSPGTSPSEEYILLHELEGEDSGAQAVRRRATTGNARPKPLDPASGPTSGGGGSSLKGHPAERKSGAGKASSAPSSADHVTAFGPAIEGDVDNFWLPRVQGVGLPEALGGWGHVDDDGRLADDDTDGNNNNNTEDQDVDNTARAFKGRNGGGVVGRGSDGRSSMGVVFDTDVDATEEEEEDGNDPMLFVLGDDGEHLDGLPGERSLYLAGSGVGYDDDRIVGGGCEEKEVNEMGGGVGVTDHGDCGGEGDGQGEKEEKDDEQGASFDHSWNDLVAGVTDGGVLHGHGRGGLPDPLLDDALAAELASATSTAAAPTATTSMAAAHVEGERAPSAEHEGGEDEQEEKEGGGNSGGQSGVGDFGGDGGTGGGGSSGSNDGYQSSCEGRPGV